MSQIPQAVDNFPSLLSTDIPKVATALRTWGCCVWCVHRFLGCKNVKIFMKTETESLEILQLTTDEKSVCVSCLGLLHCTNIDAILKMIEKHRDTNPRQFSSCTTTMTVPLAIVPREHSILVLLREKFPDIYDDDISRERLFSIKGIWKLRYAERIAEKLGVVLDPESPFEIRMKFGSDEIERECNFLKTASSALRSRKVTEKNSHFHMNQNSVDRALSQLPDDIFKHYYQCPPKAVPACECDNLTLSHSPIYIAGRYNKYTRGFGQTPWFVQGEQKIETSVEEIIAEVLLDKVKPSDHKFMASGREDVDVRMLGRGRPFMFEFLNPRFVNWTQKEISLFRIAINASSKLVQVHHLQLVTKEDGTAIKDAEIDKVKKYSALIRCQEKFNKEGLNSLEIMKDLVLQQNTPIRVLHRRSLAIREKTVHSMSATRVDDYHFKLSLSTQAGTYVKEFVHGDFGRTRTNLGSILGVECDILALDVEDVVIDWPKEIVDEKEEKEEMDVNA